MKLTFHGAAQEVTGSMHLLEGNEKVRIFGEAEGAGALAEGLREQGRGDVVVPTLHQSFEL